MGETSKNNINILEEIQKIYNDVSEWLKFLEAKHAAIFAVWTALFIAIVTSDFFKDGNIVLVTLIVIVTLIGSTISLLSFMPFLNRSKILQKLCYRKYKDYSDNIVFYQTIFVQAYQLCTSDSKTMFDSYKEVLENNLGQSIQDELTKNYIKQIVEVSTVATIKAYLFGKAVMYAFIIIIALMIALIIA